MSIPAIFAENRSAIDRVLIAEGLLIAQAICARHVASGVNDPLLAAMDEIVQKIGELQQRTA